MIIKREQLFFNNQFVESLSTYLIAADKGHPGALLRILYLLKDLGFGIKLNVRTIKDYDRESDDGVWSIYAGRIRDKRSWFEKEARSDEAIDWANLVIFDQYFEIENKEKLDSSIKCLVEACKRTCPNACPVDCNKSCRFANIVSANCLKHPAYDSHTMESAKYLEKQSIKGNSIAFHLLGCYYFRLNPLLALVSFEKAAKQGLPASLPWLGHLYADINPNFSLDCYQKSAELGARYSIDFLINKHRKENNLDELKKHEILGCDFGYYDPRYDHKLSIEGYIPGMKAACMNKEITELCMLILKQKHLSLPPELLHVIVYSLLNCEIHQIIKSYNNIAYKHSQC